MLEKTIYEELELEGRELERKSVGRMKAEDDLLESKEFNSNILKNAPNPILVINPDTSIRYVNPSFEKMTGFSSEELIGRKAPYPWWTEGTSEKYKNVFKKTIYKEIRGAEELFKKKSGDYFWVEVYSTMIESEGIFKYSLSNWVDTTDRKKAEEEKKGLETQFWQAQKMESLGTLAGGVAHDFNNLLMNIQGNVSLMSYGIKPDDPNYETLKNIEKSVQSGARLTRQLLGFARERKCEVELMNLNEVVKNQNRMFGRTKKEITIHEEYDENIWAVEIDRGQIEQVLMNLYVNAWQAMPDGGDLYIRTENVTIDENYAIFYQARPGRYLKLSVTDTGLGMDSATQQRIFEPFFTTKEFGGGTGLGLASAYGIIKNHGGHIDVSSEINEGTTFSIYLPALGKKELRGGHLKKKIVRGTETILLVDDEEGIINVGKKLLEKMGYNVLIVKNGKDAIELINKAKDSPAEPALVILDMIMPGMGGGEVFDKIKEINPKMKVLLSSGYSADGKASEIIKRGCDSFIQKPFNTGELSQKIREVLDNK